MSESVHIDGVRRPARRTRFPGLRRRGGDTSALWQAAPMALVFTLFFLAPLALTVIVSFWEFTQYSIEPAFVLTNYTDLFDGCLEDLPRLCTTLATYLSTLKFCLLVWLTTLTLGFTVAYSSPSTSAPCRCRWRSSCCARSRFGPRS